MMEKKLIYRASMRDFCSVNSLLLGDYIAPLASAFFMAYGIIHFHPFGWLPGMDEMRNFAAGFYKNEYK